MNNIFLSIIYFPELVLTSGTLLLIVIALFIKKNVFRKTCFLSILLLFFVFLSVFQDKTITFAYYGELFKSSQLIFFFNFF